MDWTLMAKGIRMAKSIRSQSDSDRRGGEQSPSFFVPENFFALSEKKCLTGFCGSCYYNKCQEELTKTKQIRRSQNDKIKMGNVDRRKRQKS